jgi:hypothetical protein
MQINRGRAASKRGVERCPPKSPAPVTSSQPWSSLALEYDSASVMPASLLIAFMGAVTLALGVFMPILSLPLVGSLNYFSNGKGDGTIILAFAVVSVLLALRQRFEWLLTTGAGSLAVLLFTFVMVRLRISEMESRMNTELADNPFRGLAQIATASVQVQWGWIVLVLGSLLLIAASVGREKTMRTRKCPYCAEAIQPDATICKHCKSAVEPEAVGNVDGPISGAPPIPRNVVLATVLVVFAVPALAATTWAITHCSIVEWACLWDLS